jgi:hypothetical protein
MIIKLHQKKTNHVLGKALAQSNVVALLNKVARRKGILVGITGSESLVSHVKEGEVALCLDNIADLAPLLRGWINTSRVVSASMQQDDAVLGSSLQVLNKTLKVQSNGVLVIVTVLGNLEARVLEDGIVVGPGRCWQVNLLGVRVESLEESTTDSQCSGTGHGLSDGDAAVLDGSRVSTVRQFSSLAGEVGNTGDSCVLLVETRGDDLVFGGANGRENVGLALVITCQSKNRDGE